MKLSTRYGLVGLGALALLSAGHWIRGLSGDWSPTIAFVLGVLPNMAAAIAIPFVFMGILADQKDVPLSVIRNWFLGSVIASCVGALGWELIQQRSDRLVFDLSDIGATIVGSAIAIAVFATVTKRARARSVYNRLGCRE